MEKLGKSRFDSGLDSTFFAHQNGVTRRYIGTCAILAQSYIGSIGGQEKGGNPVPEDALVAALEMENSGKVVYLQGLGRLTIRVITSSWAGGASRVPHPHRSGASVCSANGRSATRPDRSARAGEPRGLGRAAWGWKPELLKALPRPISCGGFRKKNRGSESPDSG